jgi:hypothetical protein
MQDEISITVGDVNDVEAHVYARYSGAAGQPSDTSASGRILMEGTLRGPYCKNARTLPAEIAFRDLGPKEIGVARAIVPDPCVWSPELPHFYELHVEARWGEQIIAAYDGTIGLRRK